MGYTGAGPGLQHCEHFWKEYHSKEWSNYVESGEYHKQTKPKPVAEPKPSKIPVADKSTLASRARSASFDINEEKLRALQLEITALKKKQPDKEIKKHKKKKEKAESVASSTSSGKRNYLTGAKGPKSSFRKFIACDKFVELHSQWAHENEIHAEVNCIINAKDNCAGAILFTVTSPCMECAKLIQGAKLYKVYYDELRDRKGIEFLAKNGIQCININALVHQVQDPDVFSVSSGETDESA
jgi:deoxycytidylate deaminase